MAVRAWLLILAAVALPAFALIAKLPSRPQILGILNDAAHAPVFGVQAVVIWMLLNRLASAGDWTRRALACALAIAAGGMVEIAQPFLGRGAEWADLGRDALGAAGGLAFHAAFTTYRRQAPQARAFCLFLGLMAIALIVWPIGNATIAYATRANQFPALLEGGSTADRYFLHFRGVSASWTRLPLTWRQPDDPASLHLHIIGDRWPGLTLSEPEADWRAYQALKLDITNPDPQPLTLTLRVHDRFHDNRMIDRFNSSIVLPPHARTRWSVPLADIAAAPAGRRLDLSSVAGVILFADGNAGLRDRQYYVTRIWLE